jgi:TctA family transporter
MSAISTALLLTVGCPSSQIATVMLAAVPLWKVIVGPRADELYRTRKGPVFFLKCVLRLLPHRRVLAKTQREA